MSVGVNQVGVGVGVGFEVGKSGALTNRISVECIFGGQGRGESVYSLLSWSMGVLDHGRPYGLVKAACV